MSLTSEFVERLRWVSSVSVAMLQEVAAGRRLFMETAVGDGVERDEALREYKKAVARTEAAVEEAQGGVSTANAPSRRESPPRTRGGMEAAAETIRRMSREGHERRQSRAVDGDDD